MTDEVADGPLLDHDAKRTLLDSQAYLRAVYVSVPRDATDLREKVRTAHNALNDVRWALGEYDADRSPVTGGFESAEALTAHLNTKADTNVPIQAMNEHLATRSTLDDARMAEAGRNLYNALNVPVRHEGLITHAITEYHTAMQTQTSAPRCVYIIEELWTDSLENHVPAASGYKPLYAVFDLEQAYREVAAAGHVDGKGWPLYYVNNGQPVPKKRYRPLPIREIAAVKDFATAALPECIAALRDHLASIIAATPECPARRWLRDFYHQAEIAIEIITNRKV